MVRWSRVKPSFPRISHDAEETGNERESKHGGGSLQFWEDCWLILLAKTRLIWHLWNQFAFEAYFPRLAAFGCRENGCDGYRSLKWRLLYLNYNCQANYSAKLFLKVNQKLLFTKILFFLLVFYNYYRPSKYWSWLKIYYACRAFIIYTAGKFKLNSQ